MKVTEKQTKRTKDSSLWSCGMGFASLFMALFAAGTLLLLAVCRVVSVPPFVPIGLFAFSAFGFVLGATSLVQIVFGGKKLKWAGLSVSGILLNGFVVFIFIFGYVSRVGRENSIEQMQSCAANLRVLGLTIFLYADENDGMYPISDKWCDLLIKYANVTESEFRCPNVDARGGRSNYALNENIAGKKVADVPRGVVLLFETKQGWNQCGGPELVTTENHGGQGCNVLFNDGHVELVRPEHISKLRWK